MISIKVVNGVVMAKSHKIKQVIQSTEKTAVITKAMQLVSASKLPTALARFNQAKPYSELAKQIIQHYSELSGHPYFKKQNKAKAHGLIVITSDRGLCGNLNLQLFKEVLHHIKDQQSQGNAIKISVAGEKGIQFLSKNTSLVSSVKNLGTQPKLEEVMPLIQPMLHLYDTGEIDAIYIAHNKFINTLSQKASISQVLPLALPDNQASYPPDYTYEQEKASIINKMIKQYTESLIYRSIIENLTCEHAARMIAMKNATDNANEIISDLKLTYNKIRQALITQEIAEISAGATQQNGENI